MNNFYNYKIRFQELCNKYNHKNAIVFMRENGTRTSTTFGEIMNGCKETEQLLKDVGIISGDRVAIVSPHSPFTVLAGLALAYANITAVVIDATLPEEEINRLIEFADVRGLFTTEKLYKKFDRRIIGEIPVFELCNRENEYVLFADSVDNVQKEKTKDGDTDIISILFSSGTTNQMKGISMTYASILHGSNIFIENVGWKAEYTYLHVFPFNHISGYATAFAFLLCGSELGMIESMDSSRLSKALLEYNPHGFGMVPKVFEIMEQKIRQQMENKGLFAAKCIYGMMSVAGMLRRSLGINIGKILFKKINQKVFGQNIHTIGTGASVCKASTSKFFLDLGLNWANIYALTESGLPATMTGIKDKYPVLTAGSMKHNPEIEIAIHNKDFEGIGEIYVKSDLIMKEYFREPELTKAAFDKGYFKTGDYGYVDDKGYLYITGRMKESILLHNGKKVSPSDIDEYYGKLCPGIMIASCGVGKDAFDEIHLFIQTAEMEKEKLTEATEKIEEQSKRNSLYQIKQIHFIDKIPVTSVGKVKRYQLVKLAKEIVDENGEKRAEKNSTELSAIYALFNEVLHRGADGKIDREMKLKEDLGMDSLSIFELGSLIEEKYRLNISDKLGELVTVNDLLLLIKNPEKKSGEENSAYDVSRYPVVQDKKIKARLKKYVRWSRTLWNIEVKGVENIPAKGTYILAPNHESRLDALWILSGLSKRIDLNRKICCLSADEHLQKKYYKVMNALGGIPVNRTGNTAPSIKRMEECLRDGYIAIIHPEGTRTRSGKLGEFKDGTAKVAIDTGVPIIPVRISGAYAIFPYDRKFPKVFDYKHFRRYRVTIDIGEIIVPQNMSKEEITKEIREQIIKMER